MLRVMASVVSSSVEELMGGEVYAKLFTYVDTHTQTHRHTQTPP